MTQAACEDGARSNECINGKNDENGGGSRMQVAVLQLIKTAQGEHGVKHHDYTRYRRYCTARLRRLYKSLKFTHGRGKYIKRTIVIESITDVRFLHILLYSAERAWGYAMAIKYKGGGTLKSCQHFHLLGRLLKAVKWAELLSRACAMNGNSRTSLEAMAYALYMKGSYLFEKNGSWDRALKYFKSARAIYEELGKYGSVENQVVCRQRMEDELDPNIRYCLYKLGHSETNGPGVGDLTTEECPGIEMLQAKLKALTAEAKSEQAVSMAELEWLDYRYTIANTKTRACILKAQQLEKVLGSLPSKKKLGIYDKLLGAYQEAKRHVRDDLITAGSADDVKDMLNGLDKAASCVLFQRMMERNLLYTSVLKWRLQSPKQHHNPEEKNNADKAGKEQRNLTEEHNADKASKLIEIAGVFGILIQNSTDLSDLATSGKILSVKESMLAEELAAKKLAFHSQRCFFLAESYKALEKHAEAYLLYSRAHEYADAAIHSMQNKDEDAINEMRRIVGECRVQSCLVHASGIADMVKMRDSVEKGVASISLTPKNRTKKGDYLIDGLDRYQSFVALPGIKEPPRIAHIPPALQAVPCKPIVFDTAINSINFPSLGARLKKEDKKKSLFKFW